MSIEITKFSDFVVHTTFVIPKGTVRSTVCATVHTTFVIPKGTVRSTVGISQHTPKSEQFPSG